ncbi:hypothetical protein RCL1_003770 [Eukaryota sp. TZLM3-RCL]
MSLYNSAEEVATLQLLTSTYTLKQIQDAFDVSTATLKRRFLKYRVEIANYGVPKPPKGPKLSHGSYVPLTRDIFDIALFHVRHYQAHEFLRYMASLVSHQTSPNNSTHHVIAKNQSYCPSIPALPSYHQYTPGSSDDFFPTEQSDLSFVYMLDLT